MNSLIMRHTEVSNLLIVEGKGDKVFFEALIDHINITLKVGQPICNIGECKSLDGKDKLSPKLKSIKGDHMGSTTKDDYKILAIQDILSTYTYGAHDLTTSINTKTGPRFKVDGDEVGEHKRFSPQNNFDARFDWTIKDEFGANLEKNHFLFQHHKR